MSLLLLVVGLVLSFVHENFVRSFAKLVGLRKGPWPNEILTHWAKWSIQPSVQWIPEGLPPARPSRESGCAPPRGAEVKNTGDFVPVLRHVLSQHGA